MICKMKTKCISIYILFDLKHALAFEMRVARCLLFEKKKKNRNNWQRDKFATIMY